MAAPWSSFFRTETADEGRVSGVNARVIGDESPIRKQRSPNRSKAAEWGGDYIKTASGPG